MNPIEHGAKHDEDDDEIVDEETIAWRIPLVLNFEINKPDRVPVLVAAATGNLESLKKMLHFRSSEPAPDLHGLTPGLVAAACGHQHVVAYLKEKWSKMTKVDRKISCLLLRYPEAKNVIDLLLNIKPTLGYEGSDELTPLQWAADSGYIGVVKLLLLAGARVNQGNRTSVMLAASKGHNTILRLLLSLGADVDKTDEEGISALMLACQENRLDTVRFLLGIGAFIHATDDEGSDALMFAIDGKASPQLVKLLIEEQADISEENAYGETVLTKAIENKRLDLVTYLHDMSVSMSRRDRDENTPLMLAIKVGYLPTIKY